MALKTNYKEDVLATTNTKRKYNMITNDDGSVSFDDVTEYLQEGDSYGAGDINETNSVVNDHDFFLFCLSPIVEVNTYTSSLKTSESLKRTTAEKVKGLPVGRTNKARLMSCWVESDGEYTIKSVTLQDATDSFTLDVIGKLVSGTYATVNVTVAQFAELA